jgi:hypothetical protein
MNKQFQYKTKFNVSELTVKTFGHENISRASLENLGILIPNHEVDFEQNIDLLGVAFNAAVVNRFNKNDDGIDTQTALKIANLFKHKPTNIEHKKEKVVGHILTTGFSSYGTNQILTPDQLINYSDPFNIALGAVVYKFVNKEFASALEKSSDRNSELYNKISTSWELGFDEFNIAVGSDDLKQAEIITDKNHIQELKGNLKSYGGEGKLKDGTRIYRLVVGDIYPLGIGYTTTPAADVEGVVTNQSETDLNLENPVKSKIYFFKNHFFSKKNSQIENDDVKLQKDRAMNLEQILAELKETLLEKKISQEAAANMTATFTEAIKKKDEEYRTDLDSAKAAAESAQKERDEIKASVEEMQKQLSEALTKLKQYEAEQLATQALACFNARMDEIDTQFELDDEDRRILAEEIKNLSQDEQAFASYKNKLEVIWRHKNKETKSEFDKQVQAKIEEEVNKRLERMGKSSASSSVDEILDNAKASQADIPNNNEPSSKAPQSLVSKFASAFDKKNILIA